jgi:hypothetical protein
MPEGRLGLEQVNCTVQVNCRAKVGALVNQLDSKAIPTGNRDNPVAIPCRPRDNPVRIPPSGRDQMGFCRVSPLDHGIDTKKRLFGNGCEALSIYRFDKSQRRYTFVDPMLIGNTN